MRRLYQDWRTYEITYAPFSTEDKDKPFLVSLQGSLDDRGFSRYGEIFKDAIKDISEVESTKYSEVRMAVGISTSVQTLLRPLPANASRADLCAACVEQLANMHLMVPPSLHLALQSAAGQL